MPQQNYPFAASRLLLVLASVLPTAAVWGQGGPPVRTSVVVAPVIEREVALTQDFVANVNPRRRSVIGSAVDGRVSDYHVDAGQSVEVGQPLAQLLTTTIEIAVAGAEAELRLRRAKLDELRNGARPAEIELAEAATRAANAAANYAKAKLNRAQRLFDTSSGLSKDELEAANAEALTTIARMAEAESTLQLVKDGPRTEQIESAAASVAVQEQVVAGLKDQLNNHTIRSPFDGFVTSELTETGAWVREGDAVAEVVVLDPVEVEVFVPEASIRFIKKGVTCDLSVDAIPNMTFTGTVDQIVPLADGRARTFPVRVLVDNPLVDSRHMLLPGMLARASLPTGTVRTRMLVPRDAVQRNGIRSTVTKIDGETATVVPVMADQSSESWISITSIVPGRLQVGDLVVSSSDEPLASGQRVTITQRMSPPTASASSE